jgi:hypothetical protein
MPLFNPFNIISSAISIVTDATFAIGDITHRLASLATQIITAGAGSLVMRGNTDRTFTIDSVTDGFAWQFGGGGEYLRLSQTDLSPANPTPPTLGRAAAPWPALFAKRGIPGSQNIAFSANPAFDLTLGNFIHCGPITANVVGPTMANGSPGERGVIVWLKDGTAGTFTIGGWGANVRFNGNAQFTAGANAIIVQVFVWDDRLGTPAWVLESQQAVV